MFGGLSIGLPPVINFGSKYLQDKVVRDCLAGRKFICLAITEPHAGSDVANIRTRAVKDASGKFYVVNGEKKWITNGESRCDASAAAQRSAAAQQPACVIIPRSLFLLPAPGVFCDFFTVAVRTGGDGAGGISLLLLERGMAGLETKQMKCMGVWPSGTTYITMDDVKVPAENLIGQENQGFKYIMCVTPSPSLRCARARARALTRACVTAGTARRYNFNHERWALSIQASRFSRVCLEEAFKYAMKRSTFGKKLIEHPVIRLKIAEMARQVECTHAQLENITYQARVLVSLIGTL